MRRNLKILGLSMMAVLAFAAVSAASASAAQGQPEVEVEGGGSVVGITFSGSGPGGKLETQEGRVVECTGTSISGTLTGPSSSKGTLTNTGCKDKSTGAPCTTGGKASGTIFTEARDHLWYTGPEENIAAVVFTEEEGKTAFTTFKCETLGNGSAVTVKGSLVCKITPTNSFATEFHVYCKLVGAGHNEFTYYREQVEPEKCVKKEGKVLESEGKKIGLFGVAWALQQSGLEPFAKEPFVNGELQITFSKTVRIQSTKCT